MTTRRRRAEIEGFFWASWPTTIWRWRRRGSTTRPTRWHDGARYTLHAALLATVKLFAPFLPHVTEEIYQGLFARRGRRSIHSCALADGDDAASGGY